jgi:hypothetical protein
MARHLPIGGQNVTVEYHWQPAVVADLVRRRVAVIATPGYGLVASLIRPGGNATCINSLTREVDGKRLALLHELVPNATASAPPPAGAETMIVVRRLT